MRSRRQAVRARARDRCEYCQLAQSDSILPHEIDHIRAQKHRGASTLDNLCWACAYCNAAKGSNVAGYDPESDKLTLLFNPRQQNWNEHFEWYAERLEGKTAVGRVTVELLRINQPNRLAHRSLIFARRKSLG
jgi:hypothetical protein